MRAPSDSPSPQEPVTFEVRHTADLSRDALLRARGLLDVAFDGAFGDSDWQHALGGMHALAWRGTVLVGHASVVQRQLLHRGRALRTGYVEGVAVHPDHRREGVAARLMDELTRVVRRAYELGALSGTEASLLLYPRCGWIPWRGFTSALTRSGVVRTPADDDAIFVLSVEDAHVDLDLDGELTCDLREGDPW